ncbi:MAG: hypothetical protein HOA17_10070 [Candidatus Melainabacteria bacterium]|jgi:hypothetical protein|nr:hypothetical protein [Candidatus Melainabacteria bacterium]
MSVPINSLMGAGMNALKRDFNSIDYIGEGDVQDTRAGVNSRIERLQAVKEEGFRDSVNARFDGMIFDGLDYGSKLEEQWSRMA